MALFGRKKQDAVLPEVDKYYEGERRDRAGLAWLLALVSVAIVALVLVGAFLAGRWVYRQIASDDAAEVAVTDTADNVPSFDGAGEDTSGDNDTEETPADDDEQEEGRVDAPARTDTPSQPAARTPSTGGSEVDLPSTGPGDVFAIFTVVSATAGATHYAISRQRETGKKSKARKV